MESTYLSTLNFAGLDSNLVQATLASISSNSMTPIIKEELKLKIQSKRLASGKEELPKPIFKEPEKYDMTPEEMEKRQHKKELNRVAARKCRNKRKMKSESVKTVQAELELRNFTLKRRVEDLEKEKQSLIKRLLEQQIVAVPTNTPTHDEDLMAEHDSACVNQTDQPSTSSGIFRQDFPHRRFSEDAIRPPPPPYPYIPRRHSADVLTFQSLHPNEDRPLFNPSSIPVSANHPIFMTINHVDINAQCNIGYPQGVSAFGFPESKVAYVQAQQTTLKDALQITCELFDIPDLHNGAAGDLAPTNGNQDLPCTSHHYEDDLPDFLDEEFNYTFNCDAQRVSPCSSGLKCESTGMKYQTTRDIGKVGETPEDFFEMYFRPLQVNAGAKMKRWFLVQTQPA